MGMFWEPVLHCSTIELLLTVVLCSYYGRKGKGSPKTRKEIINSEQSKTNSHLITRVSKSRMKQCKTNTRSGRKKDKTKTYKRRQNEQNRTKLNETKLESN